MTPALHRLGAEEGPEIMERIGHASKTYLHQPPVPNSQVGTRRADPFQPNPVSARFDVDLVPGVVLIPLEVPRHFARLRFARRIGRADQQAGCPLGDLHVG